MIDIFNLYGQFESTYNTHQAGFFRPVRDFVPMVHETSLQIFNILGGKQEKNQKVKDMLMPFQKTLNIAVVKEPAQDYAPKPGDYIFYSDSQLIMERDKILCEKGCDLFKDGECISDKDIADDYFPTTTVYDKHPVTLVKEGQWTSVMTHPNRRPNAKKKLFYCRQIEKGFEIQPRDLGVIVLSYYRLPKEPKFDYIERQDGVDVYLEYQKATSEQLEWGENMIPVFLYKFGKRYGLTTRDELVVQVSEIDKDLL